MLCEEWMEARGVSTKGLMPPSTFTRRRPRTLVEEPPASTVAASVAAMWGATDSGGSLNWQTQR